MAKCAYCDVCSFNCKGKKVCECWMTKWANNVVINTLRTLGKSSVIWKRDPETAKIRAEVVERQSKKLRIDVNELINDLWLERKETRTIATKSKEWEINYNCEYTSHKPSAACIYCWVPRYHKRKFPWVCNKK